MSVPLKPDQPSPSKIPHPMIVPDPQIPGVLPLTTPEVLPDRPSDIPEKGSHPECVPESSPDASPPLPETPEVQPLHDRLCSRASHILSAQQTHLHNQVRIQVRTQETNSWIHPNEEPIYGAKKASKSD